MNINKHFINIRLIALLFCGAMVTIGSTASSLAYADTKALTPNLQMHLQVRNSEENKLTKKEGQTYKKQMQVLERHYRNLAIKAKQRGDNPAPLFAAADHFKAASNKIVK
ncbi:MAG: hypothetical protein L3J59_04360 [Methylococcaceae bacterium]|nr:hypothetical protein [Methylococcaceae bacterium]